MTTTTTIWLEPVRPFCLESFGRMRYCYRCKWSNEKKIENWTTTNDKQHFWFTEFHQQFLLTLHDNALRSQLPTNSGATRAEIRSTDSKLKNTTITTIQSIIFTAANVFSYWSRAATRASAQTLIRSYLTYLTWKREHQKSERTINATRHIRYYLARFALVGKRVDQSRLERLCKNNKIINNRRIKIENRNEFENRISISKSNSISKSKNEFEMIFSQTTIPCSK